MLFLHVWRSFSLFHITDVQLHLWTDRTGQETQISTFTFTSTAIIYMWQTGTARYQPIPIFIIHFKDMLYECAAVDIMRRYKSVLGLFHFQQIETSKATHNVSHSVFCPYFVVPIPQSCDSLLTFHLPGLSCGDASGERDRQTILQWTKTRTPASSNDASENPLPRRRLFHGVMFEHKGGTPCDWGIKMRNIEAP